MVDIFSSPRRGTVYSIAHIWSLVKKNRTRIFWVTIAGFIFGQIIGGLL